MNNEMFELADKLRCLRESKSSIEQALKEINADIETVEHELADVMADAECPNFTRGDKMFILTNTTRWSAETERKDDLYDILRKNGYDHLFSVNHQTLASFVKEQVLETADDNGETHVPEWLEGLVKSYDDIGITMRKATKNK